MKRSSFWSVVLMGLALLLVPASPVAAAPYCGLVWGSLEKSSTRATSTAPLFDVRTGRHACYDRLVLDIAGPTGSYTATYVPEVIADGSGAVIPTRGGASIQVTVKNPAYDLAGNPTYLPANENELRNVAGYSTFRQVVWAGSFEGYSSVGLGVRARLPFRVFVLDGPGAGSRLVVDVAHRW